MKKNLRIVSAAAAALLAVAPVAASAVSVNAASVDNINSNQTSDLSSINWGVGSVANGSSVNIKPNLVLNARDEARGVKNNTLSGTVTATVNGSKYTALYTPNASQVEIFAAGSTTPIAQDGTLTVGSSYDVGISQLSFDFGATNANKDIELSLDGSFSWSDKDSKNGKLTVHTDATGAVQLKNVLLKGIVAKNYADPASVQFVNADLGNVVTSGTVEALANAQGNGNVHSLAALVTKKYAAYQVNLNNGDSNSRINLIKENDVASSIEAALKKANVSVDNAGFFKAPHTLTFEVSAKSIYNDATQSMPVTATFSNVAEETVPNQPKNIMHNAYFYDKDAKRVGTDKLTRYNSVNVAMSTTTIKGKAYYEVIENGKATGKFINAANIDGTKRTLKHNAYVYKSSKKRANKVVLKKGTEVVTYGGAYTFKNGKQYYKIGNNTDKTYVKASNF